MIVMKNRDGVFVPDGFLYGSPAQQAPAQQAPDSGATQLETSTSTSESTQEATQIEQLGPSPGKLQLGF